MRVRLLKMELMRFDDSRKTWQTFWLQFKRLVHLNEELQNGDMFNYLISVLSGEARKAVAGLQLRGECYQDAVDLLKLIFVNK